MTKSQPFSEPTNSENETNISNNDLVASVGEIMSNGKPIDWKYWMDRKSINPRQAAILSYGIDPIEWPDGTFKSGEWPKALREKIQRLYEWLAERNDAYSLPDLVAHLGENFASYLMKEAVKAGSPQQAEPAHNADKPKSSNTWDNAALRRLLQEYNEPGATHDKLAVQYGVKRQRIGALLVKAKDQFGPKKASPFSQLSSGKPKK